MESIQFFGKDLELPEICRLPGWTKKTKVRGIFFYTLGGRKKKQTFSFPLFIRANILRERACPKEPKSEVLARSKQYYLGGFQFYEMWIYGWISLV